MDKVEEEDSQDDDIAVEESEHGRYSISDVSSRSGQRRTAKSVKSRQSRKGSRRNTNKMMKVKTTAVKNFINERFDNESAISAHKNND